MIDFEKEELLTLDEIASRFPGIKGARLSYETVRRWATCGISGHKLETVKVGGRRLGSLEAAKRFFAALEGGPVVSPKEQDEELRRRSDIARALLKREFGI